MVCKENMFLRQSYENPTKILRQCGLLHCSVELKEIWAIECLAQALKKWELGEPSFLFLPPPSSLLPPTSSFLLRPSSFPFLLPPSSCLLGPSKHPKSALSCPRHTSPTKILRQSYENPTTEYGLPVLILGGGGAGVGERGRKGLSIGLCVQYLHYTATRCLPGVDSSFL